jgi:hypothetical protein
MKSSVYRQNPFRKEYFDFLALGNGVGEMGRLVGYLREM